MGLVLGFWKSLASYQIDPLDLRSQELLVQHFTTYGVSEELCLWFEFDINQC